MAEVGFADVEMTFWGGMLAPSGTPQEVIQRLNTEIVKVLRSANLQELWASVARDPVGSSPEEFAALIQAEQHRWAKRIKETGVKLE
jgi:tripartite-type tricarboxylate transporter receptor subunit TctC